MKKWFQGSTPYLSFNITDRNGALVDPAAIVVSISDPQGRDVSTDQTATKISVGLYYYAGWTIAATTPGGVYTWRPKTTDGAVIIEDTEFEFEVMEY